jgi:orotidine-5'-phosphate decarboxylase
MKEDKLLFDKPGVIVACDVESLEALEQLVIKTCPVPGIIGYKLGFSLAMLGLKEAVAIIREYCADKLVIYDHQKAGTDIPDTGALFARMLAQAGVDAAILFPMAGPVTEGKWIGALREAGIVPVVGGAMTHQGYLSEEGGFIAFDAPMRIYSIAARCGVRNFIVPGNKLESVAKYVSLLDELIGEGKYTASAPGFIAQGGKIADFAQRVRIWGAIVGRAIYGAKDINEAAWEIVAPLGYSL